MENAHSTALLRESEPIATTSTILWEIEPRLRVTPNSSLSSLNDLIVRPPPSPLHTCCPFLLLHHVSFMHTDELILMSLSISLILLSRPR